MTIGRRRFLRGVLGGVGCAVGLPALEAMLNGNGNAYASGEALPLRFGTWYFGNGVPGEAWAPAQTGPDWMPTSCLQALADPIIKPYVSIISGTDLGVGFGDHITSRAVAFSGATTAPTGGQADAATTMPSCDQIAADLLGATSTFRSLELGVSRAYIMGGGNDEFSIAMKDGQLLPAEFSPKALFDRLFLGFSPDTRELDTRIGILDAVKADADSLRARLGAADRAKLDAHLGGLGELETRLLTEPPTCSVPMAPVDPLDDGANEPLSARSRLIVDVLVQAIACDLVRVFSVRFSQAIADVLFWEAGVNEGSHTLTHINLRTTPAADKRIELAESRRLLQAQTGQPVTSFAYPFGIYDEEDVALAREAGHVTAVTTVDGIDARAPRPDPLQLQRIKVSGKDNMLAFAMRMRGGKRGWRK